MQLLATLVDEVLPQYLKSLDRQGLSMLTRLCHHLSARDSDSGWVDRGGGSSFLRGTGGCALIMKGSHSSASLRDNG